MADAYLLVDGERVGQAVPPFPGADHAIVEGQACRACKDAPLAVQGKNMRPSADDRAYEADAHCAKCKARVGMLRAEMNTLFGVREDEAVLLYGRARVY